MYKRIREGIYNCFGIKQGYTAPCKVLERITCVYTKTRKRVIRHLKKYGGHGIKHSHPTQHTHGLDETTRTGEKCMYI